MDKISEHITYKEATFSIVAARKGIDNTPTTEQLVRMRTLALRVFEPARKGLGGKRIDLSSFFRTPKLNAAVGGSSTSQHPSGEAMDIDNDLCDEGPSNREVFLYIKDNLEFDQLIWEEGNDENPDWVHVSYSIHHNRKQVLRSECGKYSIFGIKFGVKK